MALQKQKWAHRWCGYCDRRVKASKRGPNIPAHLTVMIFTLGLWTPMFILCLVLDRSAWKCDNCGYRC